MLIDPEFQEKLERLPEDTRRRPPRARDETAKAGLGAWRLARKSDGRTRTRLERLFARLFVPFDIEIHFLLDASQAMTFSGYTPPMPSEKFEYARKLTAGLAYAGLCRYGRVRTTAFAPARGRRAPLLTGKESLPALTEYLEGIRPGGNTNFSATLRNALARGDDRSVFVLLSDFADANWERGIQALMHGTSRIVLIQIYDDAAPEPQSTDDILGFVDAESGESRGLGESGENQRGHRNVADELRRRLSDMARQNDLEHFPLAVGTPFEDSLLRALGSPPPAGRQS